MINKVKTKVQNSKLFFLATGILKHPLFSNSMIMIVGANLANVIAYLYHLILGRFLNPELYGELAAILSLITLLSVSYSFLGLVIVKFVSESSNTKSAELLNWFNRKSLYIGGFACILLIALSNRVSIFLNIHSSLVLLVGPIFFVSIISFVYRSFLQGMLKFTEMTFITNLEMFGRLVLGIVFVYLGFSVFGAVVGILIASISGLFFSKYFLKKSIAIVVESTFIPLRRFAAVTLPVFAVSIATNSFFSTDVLMIKHYFDSYNAGLYAALSTMGKVILFAAGPISSVMFPMISKRKAEGHGFNKIFILSFLFTFAIALSVLGVYAFFPTFSLKLLFGTKYVEASSYLVYFGFFMMLFTLSSLLVNFYLSLEKNIPAFLMFISAGIQALGIIFFHGDILEVISVSICASSLLLGSLIIYSIYEFKGIFRRV